MKDIFKSINVLNPSIVFIVLVLLTITTVLLSGIDVSDSTAVIIALAVASIKAALVLTYFMHLNHEPLVFKVFLGVAFFTLLVIFLLTFSDYSFREMS
ncbi:MAG: cytochrome C oxidase subunit IV family protein [Candidatus Marinimicrobia bacterium]|nr:cytochrome C oxidase subunit IV family protein [Candidatus Neomarinimicrobiota bacterium]MCF7903879.1 cytochrome C oxidase subunit IV family protein [Candidatus Neomarinimicrobiota bacterium]